MNLFERFRTAFEERREACLDRPNAFEVALTPVHPPDGVKSEAARDLTCIVKRAARRYPPYVVSQPSLSPRPFCVIYTVARGDLPKFHELFEQYVDKNAFLAETFLRLKPHCEIPYLLIVGEGSFFLYDAVLEELIRWGDDYQSLDELLLTPLENGFNVGQFWDEFPRKQMLQRAEEFARWLDLWKVGIGARTSATPEFMQSILQKVVLLFLYDVQFHLEDPELRLRTNFLGGRPGTVRGANNQIGTAPFDGVAWLYVASEEVREKFHINILDWTQAESSFFALMGAETRTQFSQFILELFLLSQCKFTASVQGDVFSDTDSRLKLWKLAVTETLNIRSRLQADDVNVYEPVVVDLEDTGIGWALHVAGETLNYWKERCLGFEKELAQGHALKVQFDMFQQEDLARARVPLAEDLFEVAFSSSLRVHYEDLGQRNTLEYLMVLRVFEFCRENKLKLRPLDSLADVFVYKDPALAMIEEM